MAFDIRYNRIQACKTLCDVSVEQSIEGDCSIPDYQPEIQRILGCFTSPIITRKLAAGNKATVEGYVAVNVVYATADNKLCGASCRIAFSKQVDLIHTATEGGDIAVRMRRQYFNCRALSGRKLDFRGAYMTDVKIIGQYSAEIVSDIEGGGIQTLADEARYIKADSYVNRQLSLEDNFKADYDVNGVISAEGEAHVERCELGDNEIAVSGFIAVKVKTAADSDTNVSEYKLPFNQILDTVTPFDEGDAVCSVSVVNCAVQKVYEEEGFVRISASAVIDAVAFEHAAANTLVDAFSTEYECSVLAEKFTVVESVKTAEATYTVSESFDTQGGRTLSDYRVDDFKYEAPDGAVNAKAKLVCVFRNEAGEFSADEFEFAFAADFAMPIADEQTWEIENIVSSLNVTAADDIVSLKLSGRLITNITRYKSFDALTSIKLEEESPIAQRDAALCIYYADAGENLWDVAKKYKVPLADITAHNETAQQTFEARTMLLIPIKA